MPFYMQILNNRLYVSSSFFILIMNYIIQCTYESDHGWINLVID